MPPLLLAFFFGFLPKSCDGREGEERDCEFSRVRAMTGKARKTRTMIKISIVSSLDWTVDTRLYLIEAIAEACDSISTSNLR